jgi:hypothetical protein
MTRFTVCDSGEVQFRRLAIAPSNGTPQQPQQNPQPPKKPPCTAQQMTDNVQHAQMTFMKTFANSEAWAFGIATTAGCTGGVLGCGLGVAGWLTAQPLVIFGSAAKGSYAAYSEAFKDPGCS